MPDIGKLSKYLKPEVCKDGDIITFLNAGEIKEKKFDDEVKDVFEIGVLLNGHEKLYSPNGTTLKLLSKAWGTATEKWVKQKARITILPSNNGKDMIVAKPITIGSLGEDDGDGQES